MADTGYRYSSDVTNNTGTGDLPWSYTDSAEGEVDSSDAEVTLTSTGCTPSDTIVSLVVGGSVTGDNKASASVWPSGAPSWIQHGASDSTWGLSLSDTQVNASNFGVALAVECSQYSQYLFAQDFGFDFSGDVTGVVVEINKEYTISAPVCFLPGTKISTPSGPRNIEDIQPGDKVFSKNEKGTISVSTVETVFGTRKHQTVIIETEKRRVTTTPNHRFFTNNNWVMVEQLSIGDTVFVSDDNKLIYPEKIINITYNKEIKNPITYDLELESNHTFFANGFCVHNTLPSGINFFVDSIRMKVYYTPDSPYLLDDFNDNDLDETKWVESTNAGSLVAEQNTQLEMISAATTSAFARSYNKFVPQNTQLIMKVEQHCTDGGFKLCPTLVTDHEWDVYSEANWYNFQLFTSTTLSPCKKVSGGSITQIGGDTSTLTPPYWMRIRIDNSKIYFDYADQDAEPTEGQWTNLSNETWSLGSAIDAEHYCYLTAYNTPSTGEANYDNFSWTEYEGIPGYNSPVPSHRVMV